MHLAVNDKKLSKSDTWAMLTVFFFGSTWKLWPTVYMQHVTAAREGLRDISF